MHTGIFDLSNMQKYGNMKYAKIWIFSPSSPGVINQELCIFVANRRNFTGNEVQTLSFLCLNTLEGLVEETDLIPFKTNCTPSVQESSLQIKRV